MIASFAAQTVDPERARRDAEKILSDRRYRSDAAPRPLRTPLRWIGDRLHGIVNWVGDVLSHVPAIVLLLIGAAAVAAAIAAIVTTVRRRRVTGAGTAGGAGFTADDTREDPAALEREADEAERAGDLERAVRLRFRAGLVRLGDRGAIAYRPSVTTGEVRRALGSETFDELAQTFERVAYGGDAADPPAVNEAREKWPAVLDETRRR